MTTASDEGSAKGHRQSAGLTKDTCGVSVRRSQGLHLDVDPALVNVTVTDPYDRQVTGLDPANFRVFENNVEQEVTTFSTEDIPISIGVIFDYSGSMSNKIARAREAVIQFFKRANPDDEFFLVSFNERAELTSAFTNSVEDLQSQMMLTAPKGRTALLDAIYLGLSQMRQARHGRRALLILSDGGDNHSREIKKLLEIWPPDTALRFLRCSTPFGNESFHHTAPDPTSLLANALPHFENVRFALKCLHRLLGPLHLTPRRGQEAQQRVEALRPPAEQGPPLPSGWAFVSTPHPGRYADARSPAAWYQLYAVRGPRRGKKKQMSGQR